MNIIGKGLTDIIKNQDLHKVLADLGDSLSDGIVDESVIKNIPYLSILLGLKDAVISIQDKLFTNKLLHFLNELKDTTVEERIAQIERINNNSDYKSKVGEKLLYILDKCDDNEKAIYVGKLFQCYIEEKISYEDFLRASKCIEIAFLSDLKRFVIEKWDFKLVDDAIDIVGTGLMSISYSPGILTWNDNSSGTLWARVTPIGRLVQELLAD